MLSMRRWSNSCAEPAVPTEPARKGGIGAAIASANASARRSMLRNPGGGHTPVNYLELFFDLVFVFAITQLSHGLLHHLNCHGLAESLVLFLAGGGAWIERKRVG